MTTVYELTTLSCPLLTVAEVSESARNYLSARRGEGELLGAWHSDIGVIGQLIILRRFIDINALLTERERILFDTNPFNAGAIITNMDISSYAQFPFLPAVTTGRFGKIYEIRTYKLKPGGLPPTLAGWEAAMPLREPMSHLVTNMYALDGASRITHIWPYAGVDERFAIRKQSYDDGIWPPKGGPEQILEATSTIALPESWSPLC